MARFTFFALPFFALMLPTIAAAGCAQDTEKTQARLATLEKEMLAGSPRENWFGEPSSAEDVKQLLAGAKDLAKNGKEEACRNQLNQAKRVLGGLESRRDEQKSARERKTDEIKKNLKK